jgi:hypothetical protein
MRRRTSLLVGLIVVTIAGAMAAWHVCGISRGPTALNALRIKHEMTIAEVEAILGSPHKQELCRHTGGLMSGEWRGDGYRIIVSFYSDGRVRDMGVINTEDQSNSPLVALNRWLLGNLPWGGWPTRGYGLHDFDALRVPDSDEECDAPSGVE